MCFLINSLLLEQPPPPSYQRPPSSQYWQAADQNCPFFPSLAMPDRRLNIGFVFFSPLPADMMSPDVRNTLC